MVRNINCGLHNRMTEWPTLPGETPIDDISGLRPGIRGKIRSRAQLNEAEEENIRVATVKYLASKPGRRRAPFDCNWVAKLHKEMFGKVWCWGGKFRTMDLNIGVPYWQVETDITNLLNDLMMWESTCMPLVEQAARLHFRAVKIHPFNNGNGRWARLMANIWLRQHDAPLILWPEGSISGGASEIRNVYIEALKKADMGNMEPLLKLHEKFLEK